MTPGAQMRMVPHMAPYPAHPAPEKHREYQEVLCMIGLNPDDPLDLGAEAEFYMGKGNTLEKYPKVTKSVCVYVPRGQWHWPWQVKKVHKPMAWIHFNIPVTPMPLLTEADLEKMIREEAANATDPEAMKAELANAKTDPRTFLYKHLLLSGVGVDKENPKGGKWVLYLDTIMVAEAPLLRILQYHPEEAPYPVIGAQTHEYETFFCLYGMDEKDQTDLGGEVELYMGPEKEKHTINTSSLVYVPANTEHGPFVVKNAKKPFLFVECVGGPEHPGAIYDNTIDYLKYKSYL
jgi:mannose-6-phosphate isomerase-like protein (cupin superfamily)